ncbi:bifunctional demethylmenaquinone methyltransferase/2-methoxy-6-polyprenyl-1,4-benzoquinol methylase UbiE [Portibacter marinus]|uniref:bifunctional demethylmenaquinone methyltransferase/2-methoxy-6-polyprenyl-1,4-benzoquinol methylase UbiE n=1 Tax=Portibacter marinus TaxID=2898660 RepID=UPI001F211B58|nr:bifunctional demethylmenaquinone methyltransferase/2-methoxy-6-polyprenyl-1,4-benzoquinol methylase UbiE [Portibacter marinus]
MSKSIKPYKDSEAGKKEQVTEMFDNISGNYDVMNRIITFGMDKGWRRKVKQLMTEEGIEIVLDVATGTGDMVFMYAESDIDQIIGLDISNGMLDIARKRSSKYKLSDRVQFQNGDAEKLPFEEASFDAVSVSYGIRNFEDLELGLGEILRVLKPGGRLVVLETSVPKSALMRFGYGLHTKLFIPLVGRLFSKDKNAYSYLSNSAHVFPYGEELKAIMLKVGYQSVEIMPQAGGISTIYKALK